MKNSNGFSIVSDTIKRMAKLREQKNYIRAVSKFRESEDGIFTSDKKLKINAMTGRFDEAELIIKMLDYPIFLGEKQGSFPTRKEAPAYLNRCSKVSTLFKSCLDDHFLELVDSKESDGGILKQYMVTSRGSDLLNWLGFITIAFEKHSKIITFVCGSLVGGLIVGVAWIVNNVNNLKNLFLGIS